MLYQEMKNHRRTLHKTPELFFKEFKTTEYIKKEIDSYGLYSHQYLETGLVVYKKGSLGNKTIAFRADIDALPIEERTNLSFKSTNKNMHACGHDGHMSILLGLSKYISTINTKENILLIFQPAEEFESGAKKLIQAGLFNDYKVDAMFSLHLIPAIEESTLALKSGPLMAMNADIDVEVIGKASHAALPQNGIDSIIVSSELILQYQNILSRLMSPFSNSLISLTTINGGNAKNIICDNVKIGGTIRTFEKKDFDKIIAHITNINSGLEKAYNVEIKMQITPRYDAVINDQNLINKLKDNLKGFKIIETEKTMVVEDFSFYSGYTPIVMAFLGCKNEEKGFTQPLHSDQFNFDEKVLETGLNYFINILKIMNAID